ncbi:MAG: hypothetical protein AB7O62_10680 [Pirellulales bacterium]
MLLPPPVVRIVGSLNALLGVAGLILALVATVSGVVVGLQGNWHWLGTADEARYWTVVIGGVLWLLLASIAQTLSGVGLLRARAWSLAVTRGHAAYGLAVAAAYGFLHFTLLYSAYWQWLAIGPWRMASEAATALVIASGIAAVMLMAVYPLLVLFRLRGPAVAEHFASTEAAPHADDLRWIPQFTLRRLMIWMAVSSLLCLVVGNAVAGRHWAIGLSLAMIAVVAALLVHAGAFFIAWVASLIWQPPSPFGKGNGSSPPPSSPLPPAPQSA